MNFKNEEAVSPVIGVILMVAITVILAAVIAAFVFGMTGNVQTTKTVSMQAKLDGGNITMTISGGPDLSTLQNVTITHAGSPVDMVGEVVPSGTTAYEGGVSGRFNVGDVISFEPSSVSGRLLVVGKWSDGAEQIILDRTF
ncbi:hypothetical protein SZ63_08245 [Methanoculleus sediminis]|uniref:Archaeal Type IV pilin N-terminal domain-containing protein n=1 Tax=Methanoculleus sediminis TaxID=1550566 RepID=A0A0H1QYI0_9EURY|nr:type IV pilin N-terminal domain-containing protein [Methanoculleus sediminis]KLK87970.1 hypothetical protein SZ63_08245 [Methanoculleus sediminis]